MTKELSTLQEIYQILSTVGEEREWTEEEQSIVSITESIGAHMSIESTPSPSAKERSENDILQRLRFIITQIEAIKSGVGKGDWNDGYTSACKSIIEYIESYIREIESSGAQDEAASRGEGEKQGMRWVKASERLPDANYGVTYRFVNHKQTHYGLLSALDAPYINCIEWLDESTPPSGISKYAKSNYRP